MNITLVQLNENTIVGIETGITYKRVKPLFDDSYIRIEPDITKLTTVDNHDDKAWQQLLSIVDPQYRTDTVKHVDGAIERDPEDLSGTGTRP